MTETTPDTAIRAVIDEAIAPRLADHQTYVANARPDPLPVARADLLYLWDEYRTEYLDWAALNTPVGHGHPIVVRQVDEHRRYYTSPGRPDEQVLRWPVQYAKDLSAQFTGQGETPRRVLFCEGEREAVATAIRLCCGYKGPSSVLVAGDGYDWLDCPRLLYPPVYDPIDAEWGGVGALLLNLALPGGGVMRSGAARRWMLAARAKNVPVIVDETVTGFGRLGRMWGQQATDLSADLTVLGGPVGGGYPLGAVVAPPSVFENRVLDVSGQAGNPVACAAGAGVLTALQLGTLEYMAEAEPGLADGLEQLHQQFPQHLVALHGVGYLRGLELPDAATAERLVADARAQGLYLAPPVNNRVALAPVLITSSNELSRGLDILASVLMGWSS